MEHFKKREISSLEFQGGTIDIRIRRIRNILDGNINANRLKLSDEVDFIPLTGAEFILLYSHSSKREKDIKIFREKFKQKGIFSEEISPGIQIVNPIGQFEYNGSIGLRVEGLNNYNDNATNLENGLYRGIILDPEKYFGIGEEAQKIQGDTKELIQDVIDNN